MKSESVVIADQHAAVNTFSGLVHTINARQAAYLAKWSKSTIIAKKMAGTILVTDVLEGLKQKTA